MTIIISQMHVATLIFKSKQMANISIPHMLLHSKIHLDLRPFKDKFFRRDIQLNFVACEKTGIGTILHICRNHVSTNTNTSNSSKTLEAALSNRNIIGATSVILYFLVDTLKKAETGEINFNRFKLIQYIISTYSQYKKLLTYITFFKVLKSSVCPTSDLSPATSHVLRGHM